MPHYYFHLHNDLTAMDDEGQELDDLDAARDFAIFNIRELIGEGAMKGRVVLNHRIEVEEEGVGIVLVVPFSDAIQIGR
jgi:hypothetical protein